MANNLTDLKDLVEQTLDENGAPGSILALDHKNFVKQMIDNLGKYQGLFYDATLNGNAGVIPSGVLSWNNNAMNQSGNYFTIKLSELTKDGNKTLVFLNTLSVGDIIRVKDEIGRSCYYKYQKHGEGVDAGGNPCWNLLITSFTDNLNYTYQPNELRNLSIEFYKLPLTQGLQNVQNIIQQMNLDFNWAKRDDDNEAPNTRWYNSTRIDGKVALLGVKFQNYSILQDFASQNPGAVFTLLVDRYIKQGWKGFQNNSNYAYKTHQKAGYFHSRQDTLVGKINEIPITAEEMLLNFNQDFYFYPFSGSFGSRTGFPHGVGRTNRGIHLTSSTALGFVDLAFRIRIEVPAQSYIWESQHIGKIRMIGTDYRTDLATGIRNITYSHK